MHTFVLVVFHCFFSLSFFSEFFVIAESLSIDFGGSIIRAGGGGF